MESSLIVRMEVQFKMVATDSIPGCPDENI